MLGGVEFPDFPKGFNTHSDGDVVAHAIIDALAGALGAGSLGDHFPEDDPADQDARSIEFLERFRPVMERHRASVVNLDCTVFCAAPRVAPVAGRMRDNIAQGLGIAQDRVNVKGKTNDGFGPEGAGEAISSIVTAQLEIETTTSAAVASSGHLGRSAPVPQSAARVVILTCGYDDRQASWSSLWREYTAASSIASPPLSEGWPYRQPSDQSWILPSGLRLDESRVDELLTGDFVDRQAARGLTWDDVLAIARARWSASRAGVDIAMLNIQTGATLRWWPAAPGLSPGDVVLVDLAPRDAFDPRRFDAATWDQLVLAAAREIMPDAELRVAAHRALEGAHVNVGYQGLCRVSSAPWHDRGVWNVMVEQYVPFPRALVVDDVLAMGAREPLLLECPLSATEPERHARVLHDGESFLNGLLAHEWSVHEVTPPRLDVERFREALAALRTGVVPRRPLGVGLPLSTGGPPMRHAVSLDAPDIPGLVLIERDEGAHALGLGVFLGNQATPKEVPGWRVVQTWQRAALAAPPGVHLRDAVRDLLDAASVRALVVLEPAFLGSESAASLASALVDATGQAGQIDAVRVDAPDSPLSVLDAAFRLRIDPQAHVVAIPADGIEFAMPRVLETLSADQIPNRVLVADKQPRTNDAPRRASGAVRRRPRILVLATEWASRKGGVSTFNRGMCQALADAGCEVECLVGPADEPAELPAEGGGRLVVSPIATLDADPSDDALREALANAAGFVLDMPDVVVGHGHITGDAARRLCQPMSATVRRVHVVHTDPEQVGAGKAGRTTVDEVERAQKKVKLEHENVRGAALVLAVGPRLKAAADKWVWPLPEAERPPVLEILPGLSSLPRWTPSGLPPGSQIYVVGRMDDPTKSLPIVVDAVADVASRRSVNPPSLVVQGVPREQADEVQARLSTLGIEANVRPYATDQTWLERGLMESTIACMASFEEGFGLVGLEAMDLGIPVIIARTSGLGQLLHSLDPNDPCLAANRGDQGLVTAEWARLIDLMLENRPEQFRLASERRNRVANRCRWDALATDVLGALEATSSTIE